MYPKWGNTRVAPQLGGGHGIKTYCKKKKKHRGQHPTGRKKPNGLGKKAATQSDMGADQSESLGHANEVEAFD
jgi:hypothetical protein